MTLMEEFAKFDCRLIKDDVWLIWLGLALWGE
jgi:hypothetical protein